MPPSSHYSSTLSAGSADHGAATLITAVSTSDSVVLMNSVTDDQKTDEQEVTISIVSASLSTRKQCPCHQRSSLSTSKSRMACASMSQVAFHATSLPARVCFPAKARPGVCHQSHQISSCPPELFTAARPVTGHQKDLASNAAHQEPWLACGTPMWPLQKSQLGL